MAKQHDDYEETHISWRKIVLIPFWIVQAIFMGIVIALLSWAIALSIRGEQSNNQIITLRPGAYTYIWLALSIICLILTIVSVVLFAQRKLRPLTYVIISLIQSTIWTALFILDAIAAVNKHVDMSKKTSIAGIIVNIVLLLSFYSCLIYASFIFRSERLSTKYAPVSHRFSAPVSEFYLPSSEYQKFISQSPLSTNPSSPSLYPFTPDEVAPNSPHSRRSRGMSFPPVRDTRFEASRDQRRHSGQRTISNGSSISTLSSVYSQALYGEVRRGSGGEMITSGERRVSGQSLYGEPGGLSQHGIYDWEGSEGSRKSRESKGKGAARRMTIPEVRVEHHDEADNMRTIGL